MPLPSTYAGTVLTHPVRIVQKNKGSLNAGPRGFVGFNPIGLHRELFTAPATIDDDAFSAAHAGAGVAGTTSQTLGGALTSGGVGTQPDGYARNVVIIVTHGSAVVAMSGVITGTDLYGNVITEAWSVTAGTTSKTFTGAKAFRTITAVTEVIAADASANTIKTGNGKKLGLAFKTDAILPLCELQDGATPTAGALVAGSTASTADYRGTYAPNATLNGALVFSFYYPVPNPIDMKA